MVHAAGRRLARRTGLPLVMDLRDPWSLVPALPVELASPLWYRLAERHERRAVRQATLVVANTEPLRDAMRRAHPESSAEFIAVLNGCDPLPVASAGPGGRFLVVFSGNIYIDRDPRPFLRAAARLIRRRGLGPDRFGIEFLGYAGEFGGVPLAALAEAEGVGGFLATHPRRPHREALAFMARASMFLSLPQDVELAIPSKVFEYMQFPSWMLVLAKRGSATERLLRHTGADVVEPDDLEGIERVLERRFDQHQRGERPRPINADGRFDRRRQAERLFEALEARLAAPTPHAGGR
jgi:hypothetical protein